jgi:hypothetical protein
LEEEITPIVEYKIVNYLGLVDTVVMADGGMVLADALEYIVSLDVERFGGVGEVFFPI